MQLLLDRAGAMALVAIAVAVLRLGGSLLGLGLNSQLTGRYRIASVLIRPAPLDFDGATASRSGRAEAQESLKNPRRIRAEPLK